MGGQVSSCCGASGDKETQVDVNTVQQDPCSSARKVQNQKFTAEEDEEFRQRFYSGISVNLILQDHSRLACQVRLDKAHEFLLLACDKKVRAISLKDIKSILHTPEQLRRIESSAGISNADTCAAVHLASSGNCIPFFFNNGQDKAFFLNVVEKLRQAS